MSVSQSQNSDFVVEAKTIYDNELKERLEHDHFGEIIALDPVTHDYVLGKTLKDVDAACRERFDSKPVYIFRIGGGGAVKVGGAISRGRVSG